MFLFLTVLVLNTKTAHSDTVLSYSEPHEKHKCVSFDPGLADAFI